MANQVLSILNEAQECVKRLENATEEDRPGILDKSLDLLEYLVDLKGDLPKYPNNQCLVYLTQNNDLYDTFKVGITFTQGRSMFQTPLDQKWKLAVIARGYLCDNGRKIETFLKTAYQLDDRLIRNGNIFTIKDGHSYAGVFKDVLTIFDAAIEFGAVNAVLKYDNNKEV